MRITEPTRAEWAALIVFLEKKDEPLGFFVGLKKFNAITLRALYPIFTIEDCVDSLGDVTILLTLNENTNYWQMKIPCEDRYRTSLASRHGFHHHFTIPFRLPNAIGNVQWSMYVVQYPIKWHFAFACLDDFFNSSKTLNGYILHTQMVLSLLKASVVNLTLKV